MSEVIEHQNVTNMFAVLERASTDPNVDVEKMERIYSMVEREQNRQAQISYNSAMNQAQTSMPKVTATADNKQTKSKYAKHEKIVEEAGPVWLENGFSLSFSEGDSPKDGEVRIVCECMHKDGHSKTHHLDLALDTKGIQGSVNKTDVHGKSSTMTYGQRILTCKIFNIPTGDDKDGNAPVADALYITAEQAQQVHDLIATQPDDFGPRMLAWLNENNVDSVEEIPAKHWQKYWAEIQKAAG